MGADMSKAKVLNQITNENGMATIELIPLLLIFVFLVSYTLGAFGIVHTGILNSIAARNYAFETMRNRTNLIYFRDTPRAPGDPVQYKDIGVRLHSVQSENYNFNASASDGSFEAPERPLRVGFPNDLEGRTDDTFHNEGLHEDVGEAIQRRQAYQKQGANPVWVKAQYGICLDTRCGD